MKQFTLLTFISAVLGIEGTSIVKFTEYNAEKNKFFIFITGMFGGGLPIELSDAAAVKLGLTTPESKYDFSAQEQGFLHTFMKEFVVVTSNHNDETGSFSTQALTVEEFNATEVTV